MNHLTIIEDTHKTNIIESCTYINVGQSRSTSVQKRERLMPVCRIEEERHEQEKCCISKKRLVLSIKRNKCDML